MMKAPRPGVLVLLAAVGFAISPLLSSGFNGFTPDQFPVPQNDPPIQPAGYAFAIWGVIYLWLIIGAVFGLWRAADDTDWQSMRKPLAVSLLIGCFWIAAANVSPLLATFMIILMATTAIISMLRAGQSRRWVQVRPVALYAGWLTAASGVAIGVLLAGYGLLSAQSAALLCLIAVLLVALVVQSYRPNEWAYPLAVVWALVGVITANLPDANWPVIILAALGAIALIIRAGVFIMSEENP